MCSQKESSGFQARERRSYPHQQAEPIYLCRQIRTEPPRCLKLSLEEEAETNGLNTFHCNLDLYKLN